VPAADRVRALVEMCGPEIDALGLAPYLQPLERILAEGDNATRYIRRMDAGETHRAIFAEQVALMRASLEQDPVAR
jgi:gamma-glutamyl:cysteine ligase YbdK (ATP-grasp superfamily)